jgi:hypothetical protein
MGVEVRLYCFLNLGARWGWMANATPRSLFPLGKRSCTHYTGGWVNGCGKCRTHCDSIIGPYRVAIPNELSLPTNIWRYLPKGDNLKFRHFLKLLLKSNMSS